MHLMRTLSFLATHNMGLVGEHIPGAESGAADALSRGVSTFLLQVLTARNAPAVKLVQMLVTSQPDWTSSTSFC